MSDHIHDYFLIGFLILGFCVFLFRNLIAPEFLTYQDGYQAGKDACQSQYGFPPPSHGLPPAK